ncbi:Anhydro-N-acetylmuramic acid kinase [Bibersteinia trehalosi USDA-ARS-USMARC-188]|uniref:Anhydro-N-acetylmuramic acid kinase n=3 Tax=Bibersteinia trehalosi TaxID=47735 RepID=W0R4Q5_BIBTR|nr:Anhydro-N-acetylmuramic acid kinase [Bibersteinia trehalosi USDA-ARS-USMARC-192]AHG82046.1 Anhydro-N-acetylmuramic acid kinase [Bibersteinia trehalosi USDA-ARS-USMARC-188]AHG86134.1 Anhydro-N-acetylmuramic acid kinase [Bibersteinia trehalosi USDA-ARS-USMARC-190]
MHALLDANAELPTNFAVSPYLEESLKNERYLAELVQPIVEIEKLLK